LKDNHISDSSCPPDMTPEGLIRMMYEKTDENGVLYLPSWPYEESDEDHELELVLHWDEAGRDAVISDFRKLLKDLEENDPAILGTLSDHEKYGPAFREQSNRAWRYFKLFHYGAPRILLRNEARQLAEAMVLCRFAVSSRIV
jgi:hypothetical protein